MSSALAERVRKWGDELNQQWLEKGIEQERRAAVERDRALVLRAGLARPQLPLHTTPTFNPVSPASRTVGTVTPTSVNRAVHCSSQ